MLGYAYSTTHKISRRPHLRVPRKLYIIPAALVVSAALFFAAFGVAISGYGTTVPGAKLKFIFWAVGIIVEIISHALWAKPDWFDQVNGDVDHQAPEADELESRSYTYLPLPQPQSNLCSRLSAITTIIIGEVGAYSSLSEPRLNQTARGSMGLPAHYTP